MKLRIKKLNEETRTVSGFTEFTHNGKDSLMETDDTPTSASSFFKGKFTTEFFATNKSINEVFEYIKNKSSIIYNSIQDFYIEHKNLLTIPEKSKNLKTIIITKLNDNKERELLAVAAYLLKKEEEVAHLIVSDVNYNKQISKEIYNYIVEVIVEKKLSKIEEIVILGEKKMEQKGYFTDYEKITGNNISALLYIYKNPFYKKVSNKNNTGFDRGDKVEDRKNKVDDISIDTSKLTDKRDKNKVNNDDNLLKVAYKGYKQGIENASKKQLVIKTMYNAYDNQKNKVSKYMY